ncbi:hypothetical protein CL618_00990 [archaeon]|nr:hypothetical protein [archaeon]|tara:strand:+ start:3376 stop:3795 length:420 start_codon:yes stop_codon:yes gene_type:complete
MGKEVVADPKEEVSCGVKYPFRIPVTDESSFSGLTNLIRNSLDNINGTDLSVKVTGLVGASGLDYVDRVFNIDISNKYNLMITIIKHEGGDYYWGDIRFEERKDVRVEGGKPTELASKVYDIFLNPNNYSFAVEFLPID